MLNRRLISARLPGPLFFFVLLVAPLAAQTTPGGRGGTNPGSAAPTVPSTRTPGVSSTMPGVGDRSSATEFTRPIYVTGRVMLDDGSVPPEPVVIELVCSGTVRPQGQTTGKGHFSVTLGQNQAMVADASTSSAGGIGGDGSLSPSRGGQGITERQLMGCELRAQLAGFRSDTVQLSGRRSLDNPEVGTLVLHRLANVEGFTYSMTSGMAPKDAQKAFEKAQSLIKKDKLSEAEVQLRKAVDSYPKYAAAWSSLGEALDRQKRPQEAEKAYQESIAADGKFVNPRLAMLQHAVSSRDWQLIADRSDAVLKLNPFNYPMAWFLHGAALYNLKDLEGAEKSAREAVKLDPEHRNPRALHLLGVILADKGDYGAAVENMRGYLSFAPTAPDVDSVRRQVAEIERLGGVKTTAQSPEQR